MSAKLFSPFRASYADINGTHYANQDLVVCTFDEDIPIFGKIADIIIPPSGKCLFILIPYVGYTFCSHLNSYKVHHITSTYLVYTQQELVDYHTLSLNKSFARSLAHNNYVCMKYHVFL